jgi:hypothetical protein
VLLYGSYGVLKGFPAAKCPQLSVVLLYGSCRVSKGFPAAKSPELGVAGHLTRLRTANSHFPNFELHQHSTLFYLSLIEGRRKT